MSFPTLDPSLSKSQLVASIADHLKSQGFQIQEMDTARPWGAFLRVADSQADKFIAAYFSDIEVPENARQGERSPKILIVAPNHRLSWQYHDRRAEYWRAVEGTVGVAVSLTDEQPDTHLTLAPGDTIELAERTRHRLIGLSEWGAIAEVWIHVDKDNPSDEQDIYRLQDDFSRDL